MTESIPAPIDLHGVAKISELLEVDRRTADDVVRSGLAGQWYSVDGRVAAHVSEIERLKLIPYLDAEESPRALVIKAKPAFPVEGEDRKFQGWSTSISAEDRKEGVRGWWAIRDPESWHNKLIVITVGGFVVDVWRITDHESVQGKLHRFEVADVRPDDEEALTFIGHRMKPLPGGAISFLPLET